MRTTVDLDSDLLAEAREIARLRGESLGRVLSDLLRRGLQPEGARIEEQGGVPVLMHGANPLPVTSEMVRQLLDADE
jgi:hypothetical protein